MSFSPKQVAIILGAIFIVILLVVIVAFGLRPSTSSQKGTITVWGPDDSTVFNSLVKGYTGLHPGVKVNYYQVNSPNYDELVLNALASGQGPDVFYIPNRKLPKFLNVLYPAPATQFSLAALQNSFPDVVRQDFVYQKQIYALPLYLDTLALIYNRALFNQAGVALPPTTWNEFLDDVAKLRRVTPAGQIVRAAAALGGTETSVEAAPDILNLLMLQQGAPMTTSDNQAATFASPSGGNPGKTAFDFYLQFSNAASSYYTWNEDEPPSLDSFAAEKVAMIFDYHSALASIKNKNPFLNYNVAPVPQPAGAPYRKDYARYLGFAASRQTRYPQVAWDFIIYLTTTSSAAGAYDAAVGAPPALLSLIQQKSGDSEYGVFAKQALTAVSWHEADPDKIDSIFNQMILNTLTGQSNSAQALNQAQDLVNQVMRGTY